MRLTPLVLLALLTACHGGKDDTGETDSGDSADTSETGDTADTGDTAETGDTADTGDTGDTAVSDADHDGYTTAQGDCDDADAFVHPGSPEICNGKDDDCNSTVDDAPTDGTTWHYDFDGDGYGDSGTSTVACEAPPGYVADATDCDDHAADVHPDAGEVCDGIDGDCDGVVDDGLTFSTWYADADVDGYGDDATHVDACIAPDGYVADGGDCDDGDASTHPGIRELCDGLDNDCDGVVDDGLSVSTWYADTDTDGYGDPALHVDDCTNPTGYVSNSADCDDGDRAVNPRATEVCDGVDNDCDGRLDIGAADESTWYQDGDGDGYGTLNTQIACIQPDGYVTRDGDCDDGNAAVSPSATEACNGVDDDCDGTTDEDGASGGATYYVDADLDGYGNSGVLVVSCSRPSGYVSTPGDCDDGATAVNPSATEACNGYDDDCDGATDEAGATGSTTFYADVDGDGYGDATVTTSACGVPAGYAADATDCDDTQAVIYPGAPELDDVLDNDCDGWVDEDFLGFGSLVISEIDRQPAFGGSSVVSNGLWFEVYNPSTTRTVDMSNFYVIRYTTASDHDAFFVDPADGVQIGPGDYAVFCKTGNYESVASTYPLLCDYIWGDETQSGTYSGYYHDNTFNLQRDEDVLGLYFGGGTSTGTLVDDVGWTYDATAGYWPRDRSRSLTLDPDSLDATANDDLTVWCSTPASSSYSWWVSGASYEYGTPGTTNYNCY